MSNPALGSTPPPEPMAIPLATLPMHPAATEYLCLAIENSNPGIHAEVAVGMSRGNEASRVLAVESLRQVGRNEDDLLPAIERALKSAGISGEVSRKGQRIGLVAVSIGPGGYTSLRVSCAAAKMIAEVHGSTCVPVPTALAVSRAIGTGHGKLGVLLAGKDQSAYFTAFAREGWHAPTAVPEGRLVSAEDPALQEVEAVAGDRHVPAPIRAALAAKGIALIAPIYSAAACLQLATELPGVDSVALVPMYPREPDAVTLWRKRQQ